MRSHPNFQGYDATKGRSRKQKAWSQRQQWLEIQRKIKEQLERWAKQ